MFLFSTTHAPVFRWASDGWPAGVVPRALRLAALVFFMSYLYWEFFTPFNQFGEPLHLIAVELGFWIVIALAEASAIAWVFERYGRRATGATPIVTP